MPKALPTPDRLFDRTWRPGHPFRPRVSATRRWAMSFIFFVLCLVIGGYWFITDSHRVRMMAEASLSNLLGERVTIEKATLSIFEGLRLDGVRLYVQQEGAPDSLLFSAESLLVQYNPAALLARRIDPTRIIAVDPHVFLTEDAATRTSNYRLLGRPNVPASMPSPSSRRRLKLPEIVLRNAQVEYIRKHAGLVRESGSIRIEGQFTPDPQDKLYSFTFQSRGNTDIGPMVRGTVSMDTGQIRAQLRNFEFGPDVKAMLPADVRQVLEDHNLAGRLDIPILKYDLPHTADGKPGYEVQIELQGVTLSVRPEEWMGRDEHRRLRTTHQAMTALRAAGLDRRGFVDELASAIEPQPLLLRDVHGRFTFTSDEKIKIDDLNGWLDVIPFNLSGWVLGHTAAATADLTLASPGDKPIEIPASPRYVSSLPPAVREIYDHFKPYGTCRFSVDLRRDSPGARPFVTGQIDVLDGNFVFDKFPYPVRKASGQILLNRDPRSGEESLSMSLRGLGSAGGPNADSIVRLEGLIAPLIGSSAVDVTVSGERVSSEPALTAAFPAMTRKALTLFDAPGKGQFPRFHGDFVCSIVRIREPEPRWIVDTNVRLVDAAGALVGFPYPMRGVSGDLKIHDDNVELLNVHMKRGDATLRIDGRVAWPSSDRKPPAEPADAPLLRPDLKVAARNVPIDRDLLDALPPARRAWLEKLGVTGTIDLEGAIRTAAAPAGASDLDLDLNIALRNGALWPDEGGFAVTDVGGSMRLSNQRITLSQVRGRRGDAELAARGEIAWPRDAAKVVLQARATNLALDPSLYKLLPAPARSAWDQVRPEGTLDLSLNYSGSVSDAPGASVAPASQPASATNPFVGGYELIITPRALAATPLAVPYRLEGLSGSVIVQPDKVVFKDLLAHHGEAGISFSGTGAFAGPPSWDFKLAARNVPVDAELKAAIPKAVADLLQSVQMQGRISFEFPRLQVSSPAPPPPRDSADPKQPAGSSAGSSQSADAPPNIDFALKLNTEAATLDVGVPLADVRGGAELAGATRGGKLSDLAGTIDVASLTLAGRPVSGFRARLLKAPDRDQLTIAKMEAQLAGGTMAGQVDFAFADTSPSRYAVNLVLRNADVRELAGEAEQEIAGQLSASLALEGTYNDPNSRRGRGDVSVVGQSMYRIPLVLGLLQITNLALPITSPFTEASSRYSIDGSRVTFESIELRAREMLMQGTGHLDFGTKQVNMTFVTDSTAWPKLPLIGELIQGARHELLQIHVRGTLQAPKVSAGMMNTLTTTVDEVFRGEEKPTTRKGK